MDLRSPPPFRRRTIRIPDSPAPSGSPRKRIEVSDIVLPKGNKLVLRGVYDTDAATHDPIRLAIASVDKLSAAEPLLDSIPVTVVPFSDKFPNTSMVYLTLHNSLNPLEPDDEPRCDLLENWKNALQDANPTWEVAWAPATEGTDRRMWLHFPTLVQDLTTKMEKEPTKDETVKCLKEILKANNIAVERVFALGTSNAAAILIHPRQADTLFCHRSINAHNVLPERLQLDRFRQIEIVHPFELAITGYLHEFKDDDSDLLADYRTPLGNRDLFVFHMATWDAAARILKDHNNFRKLFSKFPQLTPPELLFSLNDGVVPWKATSSVSKEATKLGAQFEKLTRRFEKVEHDVGVRLDATHSIVLSLQTSTRELAQQVSTGGSAVARIAVPPNTAILLLGMLLFLASLIQVAQVTAPRSTFSIFSLNANGLVHSNKMAHISAAINARRPHAFIFNESKTSTRTAKNLPNQDYEIFEEEGVKTTNHHLKKWGVVLGIRKDVTVIQRLMNIDSALRGRVIAADIALQTTNRKAYQHRVFAVYTPWDPGTNDTHNFWPTLTDLVQSTTTSWSLAGDLNATVASAERASGGSDAREKFSAFLDAVDGYNLWTGRPDRNRFYDWTSSGQDADKNGGSIIDRVVTSKATLLDSDIYATNGGKDYVPNTNHRAIIANVIHRPPEGGNTIFVDNPVTFTKLRIKYPSKLESHRHESFRQLFDERATAESLYDICVNSDESFLELYRAIGRILIPTAEEAYGRVTRFKKRSETVTNAKIQRALAELRAYGGAIRILRGDTGFSPSRDSLQMSYKIRSLHEQSGGDTIKICEYS
ncbi:hypothetical protein C8R44DRAFT_973402 [Mycena epipterygia]|nr:hypothetical protein C8R44DRAFT_973402 [Mycena epipterygia]